MFERFTSEARNVVVGAQEQARGLNHRFIGTEHLLLSLIASDNAPRGSCGSAASPSSRHAP